MVFQYYVSVETEVGGADLSFPYSYDRVLVPNDIIRDHVGREYVVLTVSPETSPDPVNDLLLHGTATARPAA